MATNVLESDDDGSEFEGFNASDVGSDIHVSDISSESDVSDVSDVSDDENNDGWTKKFTDIVVCIKFFISFRTRDSRPL